MGSWRRTCLEARALVVRALVLQGARLMHLPVSSTIMVVITEVVMVGG